MVNPAEQQLLFIAVALMLTTSLVIAVLAFLRGRGRGSEEREWYEPQHPTGGPEHTPPPAADNTPGFWSNPDVPLEDSAQWPPPPADDSTPPEPPAPERPGT